MTFVQWLGQWPLRAWLRSILQVDLILLLVVTLVEASAKCCMRQLNSLFVNQINYYSQYNKLRNTYYFFLSVREEESLGDAEIGWCLNTSKSKRVAAPGRYWLELRQEVRLWALWSWTSRLSQKVKNDSGRNRSSTAESSWNSYWGDDSPRWDTSVLKTKGNKDTLGPLTHTPPSLWGIGPRRGPRTAFPLWG